MCTQIIIHTYNLSNLNKLQPCLTTMQFVGETLSFTGQRQRESKAMKKQINNSIHNLL